MKIVWHKHNLIISSLVCFGHHDNYSHDYSSLFPINTYQGQGACRWEQFLLNVITKFRIFFQMAISLLAYVAAFAVKLYYWGNYFFTLLQINYFHTSYFFGAAISSELLLFLRSVLFQNSYLFATVIFSE